MVAINVSLDVRKAERRLKGLGVSIPKITVRALNKTGVDVTRQAIKPLAKQIGIKQSALNKVLRLSRARVTNLVAVITPVGVRAVNLIEYGARKAKDGVRSKAWGASRVYKGAFIIRAQNSGKRIVIARMTKAERARAPRGGKTKAIYGPSIPVEFLKPAFNKSLKAISRARFRKHFEREIRNELRKNS
ncbi:MAG: phage tail protein [Thiotrichales bacterium]|nr:phage tail protein [Thiotrichales bacterium]